MSMPKDNFFSKLFHCIFGMNPSPPQPPTIFGLFTQADARCPERQNTYRWEVFMTDREFPNSSRCCVEEVTWHKSYSMDQHEFLRFKIKAPDGPHKAVVVVGRTVEIPSVAKLSAIALTSSGCCVSSESLAQAAVDEITAATIGTRRGDELMGNHNCRLVSSLTFPNHAPSADELSTLLATVSKYREKYHLLDSQCFWYAKTVFRALVELFGGSENPGDRHHDGGRIHGSKLPSLSGSVHEICRTYQEQRIALSKSPDRTRKVYADPIAQVDMQALREETAACQQAVEAKESERQQALLAWQTSESEKQQALLAWQASERQNNELRLTVQMLTERLAQVAQSGEMQRN
ncbi:hypothetical protein EDD17DRAFT_1756447 [Pisolithus thermaeus]|nr:hypothetical protein EV401DRAFT_2077122 [Pisolithus croceorrhizus]KAI6163439.1 hypothetical protein EDD17DRAFT_1756447 [Pisolithus thermaeus]